MFATFLDEQQKNSPPTTPTKALTDTFGKKIFILSAHWKIQKQVLKSRHFFHIKISGFTVPTAHLEEMTTWFFVFGNTCLCKREDDVCWDHDFKVMQICV